MSEIYILCEGYHDRAFWAEMLKSEGCVDPGLLPNGRRSPIFDPWGTAVRGGEYVFRSRGGGFIRVVPAGGRPRILPLLRNRLKEREQKPIVRLVINTDSDENADGTGTTQATLQTHTVLEVVKEFDPGATLVDPHTIQLDGGAQLVSVFPWRTHDTAMPGIPNQQTLERLISASIAAAFPDRGLPVENWLASRPSPPPSDPKAHAMSYMAGWYASRGSYEAFCGLLWAEDAVSRQLKARLEQYGVWQIIQAIVAT